MNYQFPERIILREYQTTVGIRLSTEQRDLLRKLIPTMTISPSITASDSYDLTPQSVIGGVDLGSLVLEIRPKIAVDRLMFILSFALDPSRWQETPLDMSPEQSLLEAAIPGFAYHMKMAFRRGLLQGYRTEEEALNTIQGRILFEEQARKRFGIFPPIELRFDEFTEDIEPNRIIKAAIDRLHRMKIRSIDARRSLRRFEVVLSNVTLSNFDSRNVPETHYTRLNEHYRPAVELARWILKSSTLELREGKTKGAAFLVDMNKVFEDFVVVALRESLRLSHHAFPQGGVGKGLRLDEQRRIHLKPDISWWDGQRCSFVGDVKYKKVRVEGIENPDLYQLLAYTIATELPGGLLIYAAGEETPFAHKVVHADKLLEVITIDLSKSPDEILKRIDDVAKRIVSIRQVGLGAQAA